MRSSAFRSPAFPTSREVIRLVFFVYLGPWVTGCGGSDPVNPGDSGDPNGPAAPVTVSGAIQKGPFILGSLGPAQLLGRCTDFLTAHILRS